jgi:hypothetical protein
MRLITGMHRSGTSLVARMFSEAGADLGDPEGFYPADEWNPDGYFEQREIHAINMPLINGPWWKLTNFHLPSTKTILRRAESKAAQIEETAAKYQGKVVKEVRFSLTLPAWEKYGTEFESILICLRDPIAAAKSISKRYHVPMFNGYYIWTTYFTRLLENIGDRPVWYIRYGDIMKEETYHRELGSAMRHMGYDLSPAQLDALRAKCVKPELHHHQMSRETYPPRIEKIWRDLLNRHETQNRALAQNSLPSDQPIKAESHDMSRLSTS